MPKFRKKPIEIEAVQYTGIGVDPVGVFRTASSAPYVITIHNQLVYILPDDWIVPEPDGKHYYPIKPEIFAASYEPVEEPNTQSAQMQLEQAIEIATQALDHNEMGLAVALDLGMDVEEGEEEREWIVERRRKLAAIRGA